MFPIAKRGGIPQKIFSRACRRVVYLGVPLFQTFKDLYSQRFSQFGNQSDTRGTLLFQRVFCAVEHFHNGFNLDRTKRMGMRVDMGKTSPEGAMVLVEGQIVKDKVWVNLEEDWRDVAEDLMGKR